MSRCAPSAVAGGVSASATTPPPASRPAALHCTGSASRAEPSRAHRAAPERERERDGESEREECRVRRAASRRERKLCTVAPVPSPSSSESLCRRRRRRCSSGGGRSSDSASASTGSRCPTSPSQIRSIFRPRWHRRRQVQTSSASTSNKRPAKHVDLLAATSAARSPDMCHIPPASKQASQPASQSFSQQETRGRRLVVGGGSKRLKVSQQVAQLRPVKAKGYLQATRRAASGPNQKTHEAEEARCARGQRGPLSLALQLAPPAGGPLLLHTDPFSSAQLGPVSCPFIKQAHRRCAHTRRQPVRRRRGFHCNGGW